VYNKKYVAIVGIHHNTYHPHKLGTKEKQGEGQKINTAADFFSIL